MMTTKSSKHVEEYKTRICAVSWSITKIILRCTVSKTLTKIVTIFENYFLTETRTTKKWLLLFSTRIGCMWHEEQVCCIFLFPISFPFCHTYFYFPWEVCSTCIVSRGVRRGLGEWFTEMCTVIAHLMMAWHSTRIAECLVYLPWTLLYGYSNVRHMVMTHAGDTSIKRHEKSCAARYVSFMLAGTFYYTGVY